MNDNILWIIGQGVVLSIGGVAAYVALIQRVTRLETRWDNFVYNLGEKSARGLHSPNDHLGLDALLDKYLSHHYELTREEWSELNARCEQIVDDLKASDKERSLAAILAAVCQHKLVDHNAP
jgi:hypothetical protein